MKEIRFLLLLLLGYIYSVTLMMINGTGFDCLAIDGYALDFILIIVCMYILGIVSNDTNKIDVVFVYEVKYIKSWTRH